MPELNLQFYLEILIVVKFKSQTFPFILSTKDFMDFIIDLESTLGQRLNTKDSVFSYAVDVMGKLCYITVNSQVTFSSFIRFHSSHETAALTLLKIQQVDSGAPINLPPKAVFLLQLKSGWH